MCLYTERHVQKQMNKKSKDTKGITLIALIITIIVLLILAMVSIRLVINSGIINKAEQATTNYRAEESKEKWKLYEQEVEMEKDSQSIELTESEATEQGWVWNESSASNGDLSVKGRFIISYTGNDTEIHLPSKIGNSEIVGISYAFLRNNEKREKVTKLVIPGTVQYFGEFNGYYITNLETLILQEGITNITGYSIRGSNKLKYLKLPSTVTTIYDYGLANTVLTEIFIPKNVTTVGEQIFGWCKGGAITVYCEVESKPEGWSDEWLKDAPEGTKVEWNYGK